jgi:hypothetical protein
MDAFEQRVDGNRLDQGLHSLSCRQIGAAARRESARGEQNRNLKQREVLPHGGQDTVTATPGNVKIENQDVRRGRTQLGQALHAPLCNLDVVTVLGEHALVDSTKGLIRIGNEH